jgi:CheY-like chemotaxis protein
VNDSKELILLVEDDPNDVELALAAFNDLSLEVEVAVARDGQEALDFLLRQGRYADRAGGCPALVLLDVKLPKLTGLQVLRQVKGAPGLRRVPVVMLTSSREERDLVESYDLGVNAYVVKPVGYGEFTRLLKDTCTFWIVMNQRPTEHRSCVAAAL